MNDNLKRLQQILNDVSVSDDMIIRGVTLRDEGWQKIAKSFNVTVEDARELMDQLRGKLKAKTAPDPMAEGVDASPRFSYESDILGNVTVRDNEKGNEKIIKGSEAIKLLQELDMVGEDQALLASVFQINENDNFEDEIRGAGTYNFPYKKGAGTARYHTVKGDFELDVVSIRDENGDEINPTQAQKAEAEQIAMRFIDDA